MPTHKINADLDVLGEVQGTSLDINGNGDISGTLNVTGAITNAGNTTITLGAPQLILKDSTDDDDHKIAFRNNADNDDYLIQTRDFTSAATGDGLFIGSASSDQVALVTNDTTALTLDTSQNATFAGKVITTEVESSGALLLDAAADITIDAGGQDIILSDDGTIFGTLSNSSGFQIRSRVNNADMFFRGVDDGTEFNALTLDMSAGGNATFAAAVTVTGNLTANGNIIGDDSTNITNIASIGADTYSADADSTTRVGMSATSMDFLVEDEDVFNCSSTTLTVDAKLVAKKRVLAKTSNTDANADGEIVYFGGTTSMDAGKIYYFNSSGAWALADADAESTAKGMLGVALGSASDTNGVLIRGMVTLDHDPGTIGDTVFLSTTAGQASSTAPSGNGDIVRVIGYCLDSTNGQIYFNPDGTFVEVTA